MMIKAEQNKRGMNLAVVGKILSLAEEKKRSILQFHTKEAWKFRLKELVRKSERRGCCLRRRRKKGGIDGRRS
jgi:hypothetical protein